MKKVIAFDLSSGDKGSIVAIEAAIDFSLLNKDWKILGFTSEKIDKQLPSNIELVICSEKIEQTDGVMEVRRKKDSTLVKAVESVINGEADGVVSAAASGPFVVAGFLMSRAINTELKPAFAPIISSVNGSPRILLDVGANIGADAKGILNYAIMGTEFSKALGLSINPIVKQLNIGSEDKKGTQLQQDAFKLMKENDSINFQGNIEANEIATDEEVDVIVTEAYAGNIALKSYEGSTEAFMNILKSSVNESFLTKIGMILSGNFRKKLKVAMNEEYLGGAIVIGLNHLVVKAHGRSDKKMFINSLNTTKRLIESEMVTHIKEVFDNE